MRPNITLVSGWLGSGKTCLISHVLGVGLHRQTAGVLIREFVETEFDKARIPQEWSDVQVICATAGDAGPTLRGLAQLISRWSYRDIFVEVVDFSEAIAVAKALQPGGELAEHADLKMTVVVIDGGAFDYHMKHYPEQMAISLTGADRIVLNKSDRVAEDDKARILRRIAKFNPTAEPIFAYMGQVKRGLILDPLPDGVPPRLLDRGTELPALPSVDSLVYETDQTCYDRVAFGHVLLNLDVPLARFKGVLQCHDRSYGVTGFPGQLDWDRQVISGPTRIAMVGVDVGDGSADIRAQLEGELARQQDWVKER